MKILLTTETYFPWVTGVSVSTDNIAKFMAASGHEVTLIYPKQQVKGEVPHHKNVTLVEIPSFSTNFYNNAVSANIFAAVKIIKKLMGKNKFDAIHVQEPGIVGIAALVLAKQRKIPVVGALHFIPEQIDRVLWGSFEKILTPIINIYIRFVYNKYDGIMTPSHFFSGYLKGVGVKTPIDVISNGTDTKKYYPGNINKELRRKLGFKENDFVFLFIGRLDRDKNVETLVRAIPYTDPEVKLLIVGRGTERKYLESLSKKSKVAEKIVWIDYISDEEMPKFYHAVQAFSIMSPYEGQSIVTLQAVASGLPIIAAKAGALPELCRNGENGFLINPYDTRTLAEKMNEIAHHKELQKKFGEESRKISLPHDRSKTLHNLELLYQKLIK